MKNKISIIETPSYILVSVEFPIDKSIGWDVLHAIKTELYPQLVFVEIHPKQGNLIDNANVRHLYHLKHIELPDLRNLELEQNYKTIRTD